MDNVLHQRRLVGKRHCSLQKARILGLPLVGVDWWWNALQANHIMCMHSIENVTYNKGTADNCQPDRPVSSLCPGPGCVTTWVPEAEALDRS